LSGGVLLAGLPTQRVRALDMAVIAEGVNVIRRCERLRSIAAAVAGSSREPLR
jgi:protein gp37